MAKTGAKRLKNDQLAALGEGEKNIERELAHRMGSIELLRDGDTRAVLLVENAHHPRKIQKAAGELIHLINHDAIDFPGFHLGKKPFYRQALQVTAGEPAVVVAIRKADPAFRRLALSVGDVHGVISRPQHGKPMHDNRCLH